jgi:TonB family protein
MNETCERLRDEAALVGRAPDDLLEHAKRCSACSTFLSNLGGLESEIEGLRSLDASDDLIAKTLARVSPPPRSSFRHAALAAVLVLGVSLFLVSQSLLRYRMSGVPSVPVESEPVKTPAPKSRASRPEVPKEERQSVEGTLSLQYSIREEDNEDKLASRDERADEPAERLGKKNDAISPGRVGEGILLDQTTAPRKRAHHEPVYPESARQNGVEGTVVVEVVVDREGNVVSARVIRSIPPLDQAALDAVREWKYERSDSDARVFQVPVSFRLEEPEDHEDRSRVDGIPFREAKGYWKNTYLPGDPVFRGLETRLRGTGFPEIHRAALPSPLPLDPTSNGAISLFLHADRGSLSEKSRVLVRVGIRAAEAHARRRPPMNVGVVLALPEKISGDEAKAASALLESLVGAQEPGDRFRLIAPGAGELLSPETFRRGPLAVVLHDLCARPPSGDLTDAFRIALEKVHAGDDPTMPLGTSLVVLLAGRSIQGEIETLSRMAQESALGGVAVSAVGLGADSGGADLDQLALEGQGRRYVLEKAPDAERIVERELSSAGRAVARAIRLRIRLADGVRLVDVLGSEPLGARESEGVRREERLLDLRLARNLGIEADRGMDEDGIQIVIPAFYAGDAHAFLLDVVAEGPGPLAEVTARYKDLVRLDNAVASASLALGRFEAASSPLELGVVEDYREHRVALALAAAAAAIERSEPEEVQRVLQEAAASAPVRSRALLDEYLRQLPILPWDYLHDSLLYASALKRSYSAS